MKTIKMAVFMAIVGFALVAGTDAMCKRTTVTKDFKVDKTGTLYVDVENIGANIEINVWAKSEVAVRVERIREDDLEYLKIEQEGNNISVVFDGDDWGRRSSSARVYASVPAGFDLDLGTAGGNIEIDGNMKGSVVASTAGGNIEVGDVDGELTLKTAGGNIRAGDAGADATLKTAGGNITIGDVKGELALKTAGGNISMGSVDNDVHAGTAGGNISADAINGDAEVGTSGGSIRLGQVTGMVEAKTAGGNITVESAVGSAIAKTAGGDIELSNIKGWVTAQTAGGDIIVELDPDNKRKSELETAGGDIELILPAGAKCTIEARIKIRDRWEPEDFEISSDFEAESRDSSKREVTARFVINGGGKLIRLETVNGDIDIVKR
jgi:DUF4097 and DUF4098 domain-containing protein YvlB